MKVYCVYYHTQLMGVFQSLEQAEDAIVAGITSIRFNITVFDVFEFHIDEWELNTSNVREHIEFNAMRVLHLAQDEVKV